MRKALLLLSFAALPLAASEPAVPALPNGRVLVDVMQATTSPRAAELNAKLKAAAQRDPERWKADSQKMQSAGGLAWDERLGITREERDELERLTNEGSFEKVGEASVDFVSAGDGRVTLYAEASLPELSGVVIDVDHDVIETPLGRATERTDITAAEPGSEGAWTGVQWKSGLDEEPDNGSVKLSIGRLNDGRGILLFDAKKVEGGKLRHAGYVLVFR